MSLPASPAAGRLLFLQLLDTMPIRAEDLCGTSPGPSASAESGSGVTLSLRMSLMAHQAAIRFPDQPPGSSRQERGRIAPADTLANAY